jgi:hypothetical protein
MSKINEALGVHKKQVDTDMDVAETVHMKPYKDEHRNVHHEGGDKGREGSDEEMEDDG